MTVPIRWKSLGSPSEPGELFYRDFLIQVSAEDIAAVAGDEDAIVHVEARITAGRSIFRIVAVEHSQDWPE